jgi:hypothetical protein
MVYGLTFLVVIVVQAKNGKRQTINPKLHWHNDCRPPVNNIMIRKLKSGEYRIYSRKKDPKTNKRRNLGTFGSLRAAQKHEKEIQYFKHQ